MEPGQITLIYLKDPVVIAMALSLLGGLAFLIWAVIKLLSSSQRSEPSQDPFSKIHSNRQSEELKNLTKKLSILEKSVTQAQPLVPESKPLAPASLDPKIQSMISRLDSIEALIPDLKNQMASPPPPPSNETDTKGFDEILSARMQSVLSRLDSIEALIPNLQNKVSQVASSAGSGANENTEEFSAKIQFVMNRLDSIEGLVSALQNNALQNTSGSPDLNAGEVMNRLNELEKNVQGGGGGVPPSDLEAAIRPSLEGIFERLATLEKSVSQDEEALIQMGNLTTKFASRLSGLGDQLADLKQPSPSSEGGKIEHEQLESFEKEVGKAMKSMGDRLEDLQKDLEIVRKNGGGGNVTNGVMEDRLNILEKTIKDLKNIRPAAEGAVPSDGFKAKITEVEKLIRQVLKEFETQSQLRDGEKRRLDGVLDRISAFETELKARRKLGI